jgi:diguanylate cyclase
MTNLPPDRPTLTTGRRLCTAIAVAAALSPAAVAASLGVLWLADATGSAATAAVGAAYALAIAGGGAFFGWRSAARLRRLLAADVDNPAPVRPRHRNPGLPEITTLEEQVGRLLAGVRRRGGNAALLQIELSGFGSLRRALGRKAGDEVLDSAIGRMQQALRRGDVAAHVGDGTFLVAAADLAMPGDATMVARRLHAVLTDPFVLDGVPRRLECRMGVALLSDEGALASPPVAQGALPRPGVDRLMANAELALAHAREAHSGIGYYGLGLRAEAERREVLKRELRRGLEHGEIVPFFQPQVSLATSALLGFEALARWQHPEHGLLAPPLWLGIAEGAGLVERLGEVILEAVLERLAEWDAAGVAVPRVGVNFALSQLRNPGLIERIKWAVDRRAIQPRRLSIEVLETVLVRGDADLVLRNLHGLAASGFGVELDDFGTGHASIANVRRFQAERIKIDRSFVRGIDASAEQHKLVASIVGMAQALGIRTLAEGVEHASEEAALRAMGCDEIQGFRIARPMDAASATAWLSGAGRLPRRPALRSGGTRQ